MADNTAQAAPPAAGNPNDPTGMGGLGAMRMLMGGVPLAGADQLNQMATQPVIDPGNKWLAYASAMLSPDNKGSFGAGMSAGLGALAGAGTQEAELRAKYLPIVAQALLQRQMQQFTIAQSSYKLTQDWDTNLTTGLTGLLTQKDVRPEDVVGMVQSKVQQGQIPPVYAQQWLQGAPSDPTQLRSWALQKTVGAMGPEKGLSAASPDLVPVNSGGGTQLVNKNPNAPGGAGVSGAPGVVNTPKPEDAYLSTVDTPAGPRVVSKLTGKSAFVGSPEAQAIAEENRALIASLQRQPTPAVTGTPPTAGAPPVLSAPPQGVPPQGVPPQGVPPQGAAPQGGAPSSSAQVDPAVVKANDTYATDFAKYASGLDDKVSSLADLNQRVNQMRQYTQDFRTGATADVRLKAASTLKDLALSLGLPQNQADSIGSKIMGGDLSSVQAFQKLAVQGAMEALRGAMQSSTGARAGNITQAEFAIFSKNNQNINTDPRGMEKVQNFLADQYQKSLAEQSYVTRERQLGTPLPAIRTNWAQLQAAGPNPPVHQTGVARGTGGVAPPTSSRLNTSLSGRKMQMNADGAWEYQ